MCKKTLMGIGLFQLQVIHLISIGKKESLKTIEKCFDEGNLIEYLFDKYHNEFFVSFDNKSYDNKELNTYFQNYSGVINGNEARKCGVMNENDGLLLILALISEKLEESSINMTN